MLRKLLKYEFMSTGRIFLPLYIVLVGVSIILKVFLTIEKTVQLMVLPQILLSILYVVLIIAVFALVYVITCYRFYKNLLGDEGYLMHTLPVKPYKHVLAKLITSFVWMIASILMAILSVIILAFRKGIFDEIYGLFRTIFEGAGVLLGNTSFNVTLITILMFSIVACITGFLMFYASMSVGQLLRGHRIIGGILAYFGFYTASQIISLILLLIMSRTEIWTALEDNNLSVINTGTMNPFTVFFIIVTCVNLAIGIGYFIITNYMLRRKLNLE